MKSIVLIDSVSRLAGGLFDSERRLQQELARKGFEASILSLIDEFTELDQGAWHPLRPNAFLRRGPHVLGWSSQLYTTLLDASADLIYRAGLWTLMSKCALSWKKRHPRPEIIAPHGMLDRWAVQNSAWKKRIAGVLYEHAHLEGAACIRALCQSEAESIRAYGLKNPIAIIPNGIDLPKDQQTQETEYTGPLSEIKRQGQRVLLFLSRVHPKKGLMNLIKAWARVQRAEARGWKAEWVLAIAGWDQGGHEDELKRLATGLGIKWSDIRHNISQHSTPNCQLFFLGPQFDEQKAQCYRACDAFILPSVSEGLPMAVLEAWAYSKPVLMTTECNLPEGFSAGAALRIGAHVEDISAGLAFLIALSSEELRTIGFKGRALVIRRFSWPQIACEMKGVYDWVLGSGEFPSCVVTE